jgi:hypothetical protein
MNAKVKLIRPKFGRWCCESGQETAVTHCLPFYRSRFGRYVHRIRSGKNHLYDKKVTHISLDFWCGGGGFLSTKEKGELFAQPPDGSVLCSTCEGRAIGSGWFCAPIINGHAVKFSPRLK